VFDDTLVDTDPAGLYMERKWRVLGNVRFALDIARLLRSRRYARRLRDDLSELPTPSM
jgi:hypothetical protein